MQEVRPVARTAPGVNHLTVDTRCPTPDALLVKLVHVLNRTKKTRVLGGAGAVRGPSRFIPHSYERSRQLNAHGTNMGARKPVDHRSQQPAATFRTDADPSHVRKTRTMKCTLAGRLLQPYSS
jgi:hypothetical protein